MVAIVIPALGPSFIKIEVLYIGEFSLKRCTPNRSHLTSFMNNPKSENLCVVKLFKYMLIRKMLGLSFIKMILDPCHMVNGVPELASSLISAHNLFDSASWKVQM